MGPCGWVRVRRAVAPQRPEEREDVIADHLEHPRGGGVLQARPTHVLVRAAVAILARREDAPLHRLAEPGRLVLFERVQLVEPPQEQEVRDLLHHLERVRDPPRPERVPDRADLVLDLAGEHLGRDDGETATEAQGRRCRLCAVS